MMLMVSVSALEVFAGGTQQMEGTGEITIITTQFLHASLDLLDARVLTIL